MPIGDKLRECKDWLDSFSPSNSVDPFSSSLQSVPGVQVYYVLYRWLQFVLHFVIMGASILEIKTYNFSLTGHSLSYYAKWLLYFPNWMFGANVVQSLLGAIVVTVGFSRGDDGSVGLSIRAGSPSAANIYTTMYQTALNLSTYVGVGTAIVKFFMRMSSFNEHSPNDMVDRKAGIGVFLMILDLFVVRFPYNLVTGLYSIGVLSAYLLLTLIHFMIGAHDRYTNQPKPLLDWSDPVLVALSFLSSVGLMELTNIMLWGLYQIRRDFITRPIQQAPPDHEATDDEQPPTPHDNQQDRPHPHHQPPHDQPENQPPTTSQDEPKEPTKRKRRPGR